MEKMIEDLLNKGYAYDSYRENADHYYTYEGFEADVNFWYGRYCELVYSGENDPDEDVVEYISGKIDEEHPSTSPENFNSLMRQVRAEIPNVEKQYAVTVREAQVIDNSKKKSGK